MQSQTSSDPVSERVGREVRELVERWGQSGKAEIVYGEPKTAGDRTIIPVAKVTTRGGGGGGTRDGGPKSGSGVGMGVSMTVTPVAVVEISPQGTRIVPILDYSKLAYAGAVGFLMLLAFMRMTRKKKVKVVRVKPEKR